MDAFDRYRVEKLRPLALLVEKTCPSLDVNTYEILLNANETRVTDGWIEVTDSRDKTSWKIRAIGEARAVQLRPDLPQPT